MEYYNEMTRQYAAATVTTGNPIGSASEETVLRNTGSSGAWGRALMNVSYDLATGRSVVQLAIPTKSISSGLVAGSGGTIAPVLSRIGKASARPWIAPCWVAGDRLSQVLGLRALQRFRARRSQAARERSLILRGRPRG